MLKHHDWVKWGLETLGRAPINKKSINPWTNPIMVVPKKSQPNEPPKRRIYVDLYGKLCGPKVFITLDIRSGYYHISLSKKYPNQEQLLLPLLANFSSMQSYLGCHKFQPNFKTSFVKLQWIISTIWDI